MHTGDIQNLTATTSIGAYFPVTTDVLDDNHDMKRILSYAIPLSFAAIAVVVLIIIGFQRRQRVLEKWNSLTRMRNTDPRCIESSGLRRDSEYDLCSDGPVHTTILNENEYSERDTDFRLATIT